MEQEKASECKVVLFRDVAKITRYNAEAAKRCEVINASFARLRNLGIVDTMTPSTLNALLLNDTTAILEECKKRVREDSGKYKNRVSATKFYTGTIDTISAELSKEESNVLSIWGKYKFDFHNEPSEFVEFIRVEDNRATHDPIAIREHFTEYATPEQADYVREAEALARRIAEFDKRTLQMSHNGVNFINDNDNWKPAVCVVTDGKLYFDLRAVRSIDPATEEATAKDWESRGKKIDNIEICNVC